MNEKYTDISFIIDRSGSMAGIKSDMDGAINSMLKKQDPSTSENKCHVNLYDFDTIYRVVEENVEVQNVKPYSLEPGGMTALYDAVGKTINARGAYFTSLKEEDRPGKVIVVIVTDGLENASKEFTAKMVRDMIEEQKTKYSWEFVYIGVGIESFADAKNMGIKMSNSSREEKTSGGIQLMSDSVGNSLRSYRTMSKPQYDLNVADENNKFLENV